MRYLARLEGGEYVCAGVGEAGRWGLTRERRFAYRFYSQQALDWIVGTCYAGCKVESIELTLEEDSMKRYDPDWQLVRLQEASQSGDDWRIERHVRTGQLRCSCPSYIYATHPKSCKHTREQDVRDAQLKAERQEAFQRAEREKAAKAARERREAERRAAEAKARQERLERAQREQEAKDRKGYAMGTPRATRLLSLGREQWFKCGTSGDLGLVTGPYGCSPKELVVVWFVRPQRYSHRPNYSFTIPLKDHADPDVEVLARVELGVVR